MSALAALGVAGALTLTACSTTSGSGSNSGAARTPGQPAASSPSSSSTPAVPDATITTTPAAPAAAAISPVTPVTVSVAGGTLTSVTLVNPAESNKAVTGTLSADSTTWTNSEPLGYGQSYSLTAVARNSDGKQTTKTSTVTTVKPGNLTMPYLQRIGGYTLDNGATYGVGIVPVVHFDEPITDKAAAEKALTVTTTPQVDGVWYWADSQNAHYRPQTYWPSGTKVTISANVYGVKVGAGLYGQADASASFTIGRKQVTVASDNAPAVDKVNVYDANGTVIKTMNTSMGKHSSETVNGTYINFYTMNGTYTVLEHDNPAIMSSASYGLPANAPGGYAPEPIYWSTKISTDGIYLHQLDSTVYEQNNGIDTSHGCLNLTQANATWFYQHSLIGDPVEIQHTGGPAIQVWQGGDWSVPWSTWKAGSALS